MDTVVTPIIAPAMNPAICDMPLLPGSNFHTSFSPSVIVFTLAIGTYYLNGMWQQGSSASRYSWISALFIFALALAQTRVISIQKACPPVRWSGIVIAWVVGILAGTIGYWIAWRWHSGIAGGSGVAPVVTATMKENFGNPLFDVNSGVAFETSKSDEDAWFSASKNQEGTHCKVPDDETYYVDMYKDGTLVTQAIGERLIS
jgi:hypothetical protein